MHVTEHGGLVALLYLSHSSPRPWATVALISEVADRARTAIKRLRSEEALGYSALKCKGHATGCWPSKAGKCPRFCSPMCYAGDVGSEVGGPRQGNAPVAHVLNTTGYSRNAVRNGTLDFGTGVLTKPSARWWIESKWATASGAHPPSLPHFSRGACRARCAGKRAGSPSYRHRHRIDASAALICRANGRAGLSISCPSGSTYETDSGITR